MATGDLITKANFPNTYTQVPQTLILDEPKWIYVCSPAFEVDIQTLQPTTILYHYTIVDLYYSVYSNGNWTNFYDQRIHRGQTIKHSLFVHNTSTNSAPSSAYSFIQNNGNSWLYELKFLRPQGEESKAPITISIGGIGNIDISKLDYDTSFKDKNIYGIGGNTLFLVSDSENRQGAINTFNTALKRNSHITNALANFCINQKLGE